jgi:hypothetical protein
MFLEQDIITETFLEKIIYQYLEQADMPQVDFCEITEVIKFFIHSNLRRTYL